MPRAMSPTATTERTVVSFAMVPSRLLLLVGLTLIAPPSLADETKDQCLRAYADAQRARKREDLLEARAQLNVCSRSDCPAILQTDCVRWLREVEEAMPSIVIGVRRPSGEDLGNAKITLDGRPLRLPRPGSPVELSPGTHLLRVTDTDGSSVERSLVVNASEKNRLVLLTLPPRASAPAAEKGSRAPSDKAATEGPVWPYILGGLGILAAGAGVTLDIMGSRRLSELHDTCKPNCSESDVSSTRTEDHRG